MNNLGPPVPSLKNLTYQLYRFISQHPLIASPPITHPLTGETVKIGAYRLYPGLNPNAGLTCSIYAYPGSDAVPNPRTTSVSAIYEPYELGEHGSDHAVYHIAVTFYFNEVTIGNFSLDEELITVPAEAALTGDQLLLTTSERKLVDLEINPALDIISDYLEMTRLILSDWHHKQIFSVKVNSFEALYANVNTSNKWEEKLNIYFHEGTLMTRLDAYVSRGWRDKFTNPVDEMNININRQLRET